jgi:hypothetical protein
MARVDLFSTPHKGLRAELCRVATLAARTDFDRPGEALELAQDVLRLVGHLQDHADRESRQVMPELARVAPELHRNLVANHASTDLLQREVAEIARQLLRGAPERVLLGRRLHRRLWQLTAEQLHRMEREETEAMPALWAHHGDPAIRDIRKRVRADMQPRAMVEWGPVLLAAVSLPERAELLAPLVDQLPRLAVEALIAPVRSALGERWAETAAAIGL